MGNSVETRLPCMDRRLVELGSPLPEAIKIRGGYGKWVLREAMRDRRSVYVSGSRANRGFNANHSYAISSGLGANIRQKLNRVSGQVAKLVGERVNPTRAYPNQRPPASPAAVAEAIAPVWLGQRFTGTIPASQQTV